MSPRSRYSLAILLVIVAVVCVELGFWQLRRLHHRRAANAIALAARRQPPVDLSASAAVPPDSQLAGRRVSATGQYDHDHDLVLRGQSHEGEPGVAIVTPLRIPGRDTAVLVDRGFVPSPDAFSAEPDTMREPGTVTVRGLALAMGHTGGEPIAQRGETTYRRLDAATLRTVIPYPIRSVYILQAPDTALPPLPRRLEPEPLSNGPHLNYAIQWFAFATTALVFAAIFFFRRNLD